MEIKSLVDCLHHRSMFLTTNWRQISRRDCLHFTWGISNANQHLIRVRFLVSHIKTNNSKCYTCIGYAQHVLRLSAYEYVCVELCKCRLFNLFKWPCWFCWPWCCPSGDGQLSHYLGSEIPGRIQLSLLRFIVNNDWEKYIWSEFKIILSVNPASSSIYYALM